MMRAIFTSPSCIFTLLLAAVFASAQSAPPTVYVESFRKGPTRVTEESFEAKLSPVNPTYRERIKDSAGNDRYELTISPQIPEGDNKVTGWIVRLKDLHHAIFHNLLMSSQEPSSDAANNLWWLKANQFAPVPIRDRRIVKVESFYVAFQVKNFHFTPLDSPYLDSMSVQFSFTNSDPRSASQ
jgi:hypothetical protein